MEKTVVPNQSQNNSLLLWEEKNPKKFLKTQRPYMHIANLNLYHDDLL